MADTKARPTYAADFIKGDWDKAVYLDNPHTDNLMTVVLALGAEFWTMRRRLMVVEKFLETKSVAERAAIEAFVPSTEEGLAWDKERDEFIARVFSALTRPTAKLASAPPTARVPVLDKK
jgi:hypothetical protein